MSGRSDQFSLGIVAFQVLFGFHPFLGDTEAETMANISRALWFCDHMPKQHFATLGPIFYRVFAQRPDDRFPSCWEFIQSLAEHFGLEPTSGVNELTTRRLRTGTLRRDTSSSNRMASPAPAPRKRLRSYLLAGLSSALLAVTSIVIFAQMKQIYSDLPRAPGYEPIEDLQDEIVKTGTTLPLEPEPQIRIKLRGDSLKIGATQFGKTQRDVLILFMDQQNEYPLASLIVQFDTPWPDCTSSPSSYNIEFHNAKSQHRTSLFRSKKSLPPGEVFTFSCDSSGKVKLHIEGAFPGIQSSWKILILAPSDQLFRWKEKDEKKRK